MAFVKLLHLLVTGIDRGLQSFNKNRVNFLGHMFVGRGEGILAKLRLVVRIVVYLQLGCGGINAIFIILFMLLMRHILFLEFDLLILEIGPFEVCLTINVPLLQTLYLPLLALKQPVRRKQARQQDHPPLPQQPVHLHLSFASISVAKLTLPFYPRPDLPRLHL